MKKVGRAKRRIRESVGRSCCEISEPAVLVAGGISDSLDGRLKLAMRLARRTRNTATLLLLVIYFSTKWEVIQTESLTMPHIPKDEMSAFVAQAHSTMVYRFNQFEPQIYRKGVKQTPGSPEWFMAASHSSTQEHRNLTHAALLAEEATKYMSHALGLSPDQISYGLPEMDVSSTSLMEVCPVTMEFPCEAHKYRSMTGHCNNVQNPHWGNAGTRYVRYLPPDYADGISLPRGTAQ